MDVKVNVKPPRFSDKNRFTSSRPDAVLIAPISVNTEKQQTSNEEGWDLRSGWQGATEGDQEHLTSTASH